MTVTSKSFPILLRERRELKNLSIRGLGRITGIDFSTIAKIEKGDIGPTLDTAIRIAKALDFSLDDASSPFREHDNQSLESQREAKFLTEVRFKFQTIKRGRRKNISKIAAPFQSAIVTQGILLLLTGPEPRCRVTAGTLIDVKHLLGLTTWALAISDVQLFWIGDAAAPASSLYYSGSSLPAPL